MKTFFKLLSFIIVFLVCIDSVSGYEIKILDSFKLSQEKKIIAYASTLCVTEDELYLIPDMKLGHVKVFGNDGRLIKVLGGKGFGPDEFDKPYYSFYKEKKYGVYDMTTWQVHLYERSGRGKSDFKRVKSVFCTTGVTDVQLKGGKLFLTGILSDKEDNPYCLFAKDIELQKNELLLPAYYQSGFDSFKEYKARRDLPEIRVGGAIDLVDLGGDSAYYIWEGDLSVVRINLSTGTITRFGHKSPHYIKPFLSQDFIKADEIKFNNPRARAAARWKMSYVHDLFASDAFVLVIFRGPHKDEKLPPYTAQFYTLGGEFVNEVLLPLEREWRRFFLDKEKSILYAVANSGENDEEYYIVKMKISGGK